MRSPAALERVDDMPVEHERDALNRLVAGGVRVELLDRDVAGDAQKLEPKWVA